MDDKERRAEGIAPGDGARFREQQSVMDVFDVLIHNEDRNTGNVLYTRDPVMTHLSDHTRAFRARTERPAKLRGRSLFVDPELRRRLLRLDEETLDELVGDVLVSVQIRAILERRDELMRDVLDPR